MANHSDNLTLFLKCLTTDELGNTPKVLLLLFACLLLNPFQWIVFPAFAHTVYATVQGRNCSDSCFEP